MLNDHIGDEIWRLKYRFEGEDSVHETHKRIASTLAKVEAEPEKWYPKFMQALDDFKFLPAGRIISGIGTSRDVTLFNCYVMGTIPDSMDGIFTNLREAALTMQQGGGIGYDFSTIRPKGAPVVGVGADASGPLSFMDVWDSMCRTVMSAGSRRGAMMATLRCDHPDILDFIDAKRDSNRLRMFNVSVLVTDDFMKAVENDKLWQLKFGGKDCGYIKARSLWNKIMRATYDYAEPGVIFIDRINQTNPLKYCETISATNPCGEQPLPPYGACLLGSINLTKFIRDPFKKALVDWDGIRKTTRTAIRMMDNVIEVSNFPLHDQHEEAFAKRRIGLGITGLADALLMLGVKYGSEEAMKYTASITREINDTARETSYYLGIEKGSFPLFKTQHYSYPEMRNSHVTSIAPTGTISLLAGNVSSGIEPIFAPSYTRKVLQPDGSKVEMETKDYAVALWHEMGNEGLPPAYVDAQSIPPEAHVRMQAAAQPHVDSSISKTINVPKNISFEDFKNVYMLAWETGCKGCTTYRPNEVTGSVISVQESSKEESPPATAAPPAREEILEGATYKLRWPESAHAIYITINDIETDGIRRPFEVFINSKNMEHYAWTVALTRMISAVFRRGGEVAFVVEELKAVFDPRGGAWMQKRYIPSIIAAIGDVIERHMVRIGFLNAEDSEAKTMPPSIETCSKCGSYDIKRQEGCDTCATCGYSKCE